MSNTSKHCKQAIEKCPVMRQYQESLTADDASMSLVVPLLGACEGTRNGSFRASHMSGKDVFPPVGTV